MSDFDALTLEIRHRLLDLADLARQLDEASPGRTEALADLSRDLHGRAVALVGLTRRGGGLFDPQPGPAEEGGPFQRRPDPSGDEDEEGSVGLRDRDLRYVADTVVAFAPPGRAASILAMLRDRCDWSVGADECLTELLEGLATRTPPETYASLHELATVLEDPDDDLPGELVSALLAAAARDGIAGFHDEEWAKGVVWKNENPQVARALLALAVEAGAPTVDLVDTPFDGGSAPANGLYFWLKRVAPVVYPSCIDRVVWFATDIAPHAGYLQRGAWLRDKLTEVVAGWLYGACDEADVPTRAAAYTAFNKCAWGNLVDEDFVIEGLSLLRRAAKVAHPDYDDE